MNWLKTQMFQFHFTRLYNHTLCLLINFVINNDYCNRIQELMRTVIELLLTRKHYSTFDSFKHINHFIIYTQKSQDSEKCAKCRIIRDLILLKVPTFRKGIFLSRNYDYYLQNFNLHKFVC